MPSNSSAKPQTFFFEVLSQFYRENKGKIWKNYRIPTRKFLEFLDPEAGGCLRRPQFNAFEIYVFLKEFCQNAPITKVFEDWCEGENQFKGYPKFKDYQGQQDLFSNGFDEKSFKAISKSIKNIDALSYSNYIYALSMGVGKTRLMACCIFYEFTLANLFQKDNRYCQNALIFAPDTTVLRSLREIQTTDKSLLIPPDYFAQIDPLIKFEYLTEQGVHIQAQAGSKFNIIVSNNQKIILKNKTKPKTGIEKLFEAKKETVAVNDVMKVYQNLGLDDPFDDSEMIVNQRILKLGRLPSLGVFVDEAHHAFGGKTSTLKATGDSSLRMTIHYLAKTLDKVGSHVVACYHFTGTPYTGKNKVFPEVVFDYGLVDAIKEGYLKDVRIESYSQMQHRNVDFLKQVVDHFIANTKGVDAEGMLPKLAIFAATVDELITEVKPQLERILSDMGISLEEIVVNVGDKKITKDEDLKEFNRLDTVGSKKRFILLVNKGTEGWNCRSLFGVALNRSPSSKIFVLQSTMRCLRSIGRSQQVGNIYISQENEEILDSELQKNLGINLQEFKEANKDREEREVLPVPPPVKVKFNRLIYKYSTEEKKLKEGYKIGIDSIDLDMFRSIKRTRVGIEDPLLESRPSNEQDISSSVSKITYTKITLVAEIAKYLSKSCLFIQDLLELSEEGIHGCLELVNNFNDTLYLELIPRLFHLLYEVSSDTEHVPTEIELVNPPDDGHWTFKNKTDLFVSKEDAGKSGFKSFHVSPYSFDSSQERKLLWHLLDNNDVEKVWFTGMFTQGQSDFFVQYIDSESSTVCKYYPDFLVRKKNGEFVLVEVKAKGMIKEPR